MSMKKLNWLASPVINRKRKSKLISKRHSAACLSACSTSWFGTPGDFEPAGGFSVSAEYIKTKGSDAEFGRGRCGGGGKLRKRREFGSTGDLLEGSAQFNGSVKHFLGKSMEQLPVVRVSSMKSEVGDFRTETGADCSMEEICHLQPLALHNHALLENPESETRWYFKYFLGKYHVNYLCSDGDKNPMFLSVVPSESIYRCILWRKTGNKRLCVKHSKGKWPAPKSILEKFSVRVERGFKEIVSPSIQKDLLTLEEQEGSVNFKFGVIYAKSGQKTDNEMYCNEHGSEKFDQFLELLGDEVQLRGWQQFKGGLDNKNDSTGLSTVYTVFEGHEVMFHVSTLLPYTTANEQQLERKRHIGNDIVVIIFVDYDTDPAEAYRSAIMDFDPSYMRSHFNHIFALVTYSHVTESYRLVVHTAESVPAFGPSLPPRGEFNDFVVFRDFLLAKLINGEKAAYCTPTFSHKRERTLGLLLKGVEKNYSQEMRRATSTPALNHSPNTYKKFNEKEKVFTEFGQRLKVEKIITGLHPTSQRTTVTAKREPWETECVVEHFPHKILHGDVCDDGIFLVNTANAGSYFIYRDSSYSLIMDQSIVIGQLVVAHRHQLLLFRTNYPRDSNYLYAIPLKQFYNDAIKVASKSSISRYQVPHSKGVSLFCSSHLSDQFLRLAVAVKNKVYMLAYKHPAVMLYEGSPLTPLSSTDPKDNFIKHRELVLMDMPLHMTLLDERPSGKLCVTYQKLSVVDAIDEIMATTQRIPNLDIAKTKLTTLTSLQSGGGRSELLIGYSLISQLITLHESTAYNSLEIMWNTEPLAVVYLQPYMVAFTEHTVEVRMASNGSLMQTISVPDLKLLSAKGDLYFTSSSCMVYTASCKTPTSARSFSHLPTKLPKNMDKRDLATSGKHGDSEELTYMYKISLENMTGRRDVESGGGFETSFMTQVSSSDVVTILSDSEGPGHRFDDIHPVFRDGDVPVMRRSFQEHISPVNSLTRRVQSARYNTPPSRDNDISLTITEYGSSTPPPYRGVDHQSSLESTLTFSTLDNHISPVPPGSPLSCRTLSDSPSQLEATLTDRTLEHHTPSRSPLPCSLDLPHRTLGGHSSPSPPESRRRLDSRGTSPALLESRTLGGGHSSPESRRRLDSYGTPPASRRTLGGHSSPSPPESKRRLDSRGNSPALLESRGGQSSPSPPEFRRRLDSRGTSPALLESRRSRGPSPSPLEATLTYRTANSHTSPALLEFSRTSETPAPAGVHSRTENRTSPAPPPPTPRDSTAPTPADSPPHTKLRRARKVLTSRKSLDSGSRWLYPYFPSHGERFAGETSVMGHMTDHGIRSGIPLGREAPEVLGALENVVYSSPDSGMHDDLSLSSNSDETSSRGEPHH